MASSEQAMQDDLIKQYLVSFTIDKVISFGFAKARVKEIDERIKKEKLQKLEIAKPNMESEQEEPGAPLSPKKLEIVGPAIEGERELLTQIPVFLSRPSPDPDDLARAAVKGNITEMEYCLQGGVDINSQDTGRTSVLANALMNKKANAVQFILKRLDYKITTVDLAELQELMEEPSRDLDEERSTRDTLHAFRETVSQRQLEGLEVSVFIAAFLKKPKNELLFSFRPLNFVEQLSAAARAGKRERLQSLLQTVDINSKDITGTSLLANAVLNKRANIVQYILQRSDYRITQIDIDEVRDLISEARGAGESDLVTMQATLDAFKTNVTSKQLQGLEVSSIESILSKQAVEALKDFKLFG